MILSRLQLHPLLKAKLFPPKKHEDTLKCLVKVPGQLSAQGENFSKIDNRTDYLRAQRGIFFLKKNKPTCSFIRHFRMCNS